MDNFDLAGAVKPPFIPSTRLAGTALLMLALALAGCGNKEKKAGQSLASVNGEEITVLQLNEELQRSGVQAARQEAASKQLLEVLIDRQLLQNEAAKEKLDRDPKVVQAVERAKALIVAQAYMQKRIGNLPRPDKAEVEEYYRKNPQFFANRKQFDMKQLVLSTADLDAQVTYGSSGSFVQQLANGARFDVFLSADADYPQRVVAEGLAAEGDLFPYAVGRSVLWLLEGSPAEGLRLLTRDAVRKVAVANPETAPYGRVAVEALRAAGVYDDVRPKLVYGENVAQAADFVVSGGADAGIVPRSLVVSPRLEGTGRWADLAEAPGLEQVGVLLTDDAPARALRDLLLGERGRRVLQRFGFDLPER